MTAVIDQHLSVRRYRQFGAQGGEPYSNTQNNPAPVALSTLPTDPEEPILSGMARKPKSSVEPPTGVPLEERLPAHKLATVKSFAATDALKVEGHKIQEIVNLLWLPAECSREDRDAQIVKAVDLFESIRPTDGLEAMVAGQMVGAHHAAMECLRRAMLPGQTFEGRNLALTQAQRLMKLYLEQVSALDKHRGKGQQQVTVKHVYVEAGGQAIVGDVNPPHRVASDNDAAAPANVSVQPALEAPVAPILPSRISAMPRARVPRP